VSEARPAADNQLQTGETNMEWQNRRRALARGHVTRRLAGAAFALSALALAALLTGCFAHATVTTASAAQSQDLTGQWLVEYRTDEGKTSLTLRHSERRRDASGGEHSSDWNTTRNVAAESLRGLTPEQANSAAGTNVRFEIRRDAGTFVCEGWFKQGKGSGHFNFVPDQGFASELTRRGVGTPDTRQLFALAAADVGLDLLDELKTQGYDRPTVEEFVRMGDHGVRADYVKGLLALGYRLGTVEELVRMRDHGVSLDYIRSMRGAGFNDLTAAQLVRARDHGVGPDFIREIQAAGFQADSLDGLVRIRDHGVSAGFIKSMRAEGYDSLTLEQLVRMRDHGVTTEYVRELRDLGYTRLPAETLVRMRDHGVTPDFVRQAKSRASATLTPDALIRMRDSGSYQESQ
jgi:hypothetical protein